MNCKAECYCFAAFKKEFFYLLKVFYIVLISFVQADTTFPLPFSFFGPEKFFVTAGDLKPYGAALGWWRGRI